MTRLTIICISFIIVSLMFAGQSYAQIDPETILGIWLLDEGNTEDASGNGHDGTLIGSPNWVAGKFGSALEFVSGSYVDCGNDPVLNVDVFSVSFWCNIANTQGWIHMVSRGQHFGGGNPGANNWGVMMVSGAETIRYEVFNDTGWATIDAGTTTGEWHHVVATYDGDTMQLYHDGVLAAETSGAGVLLQEDKPFFIGAQSQDTGPGGSFEGSIDEVGYFNTILTPEDIEAIMNNGLAVILGGQPLARRPDPKDGALLEQTWGTLSWSPGDFAVSHDVYFGDNFDDVNDGAEGTFQGNQAETFIVVGFPGFPYPDGLVPDTTYYWRIDEVNDTDPNSPWKGPVWSFSIPPKTAYYPDPADVAEQVDTDVQLSWTGGFGAKLHTVYFGENFDEVDNATGGLPQGVTTYDPATLKLAKTYYWRVDEFDAVATFKGDVWSFTTQGAVQSLDPSNGAVDVKQTAILTWSPSVYAASHEVYFGADKDAVKNADTGSPEYKGTKALASQSYDPGKLELDATYYWRIDEVNDVNPDSPWTGILWSFTTAGFLVVDDFEDYDSGDNQIWYSWEDGLGYGTPGTDPYSPGNGTGSAVGDENTASFTEETIVHGGSQSMPFWYDNSILKYSEVEKTLTYPRDWTEEGVNTLSIWFRGDSANAAETLYVALNGSAVVTHDNPNAAQIDTWTQWTIDLQAFADQGVNLANVNTIAIGFGDKNNPLAGGSGMMYFDDIRLYRPAQ